MVRWFVLLLSIAVAGCAGRGMVARQTKDLAVKPDEALIIIMRARYVYSGVPGAPPAPGSAARPNYDPAAGLPRSVSLYDVTDEEIRFIGIIREGQRVAVSVKPGKTRLMLYSRSTDFLEANVAAGKTYYARIGADQEALGAARHAFIAMRASEIASAEFKEWDSGTTLVTRTERAEAWAERGAGSIAQKRTVGWQEWTGMPEAARKSRTLEVADGR